MQVSGTAAVPVYTYLLWNEHVPGTPGTAADVLRQKTCAVVGSYHGLCVCTYSSTYIPDAVSKCRYMSPPPRQVGHTNPRCVHQQSSTSSSAIVQYPGTWYVTGPQQAVSPFSAFKNDFFVKFTLEHWHVHYRYVYMQQL